MCFRWGVDHLTTTPYYTQSSLAERVNRNLKSALKIYHHESQNLWDDNLPWLGLGFNTSVHESTCSTPDVLFLGREMRSPLDVRWDLSPNDYDSNVNANNSRWAEAFRNLLVAKKRVARKYYLGRKADHFCEGNSVRYRLNLSSSKGQNISAKMLLRWSTPVKIVRKIGPNVVLLADPDTGSIVRRAHVSQLRPCVK